MYNLVLCFCSCPIGYTSLDLTLVKLLSFTNNIDRVTSLIKAILETFKDHKEDVQRFIKISANHIEIFQTMNKEKGLSDLIVQFNKIYPYDDMMIQESLANALVKSKELQELFTIFMNETLKTDKRRVSEINLTQQYLNKQKITKLCCRNQLLVQVDFYNSRAYYCSKLV